MTGPTNPTYGAPEGDERIRTAARWLSTAYRYVGPSTTKENT